MLTDIINFLEISPTLATAGLPESGQFDEIYTAGYEVVINLLPVKVTEEGDEEQALVTRLGMDYVNIPVIWSNPTAENLDDFFTAMQANRDRKVFVHCAMNFRASAFTFLYRVLIEKLPIAAAKQAMDEIWEPYEAWPEFIEQQLRRGSEAWR